ncbi:MAG: hypothetical protein V4726_22745 [Verrucomicrobiota bacterium]
MRIRTVLISLLSFAAGGAAAWRIHPRPPAAAGLSVSGKTGGLPDGSPGAGTDAASVWQVLLKGGGQGISDRLLQADLVSRATVREMPRLLELAGKDQVAREMLLRRWAALDPAGAAAWLEPVMKMDRWPGPEGREKDVDIVFSAWAKTDPAAALARLRAGASVGNGILWTGTILTRLLSGDMAAGVRLGAMAGSTMDLTQSYYSPSEGKWVEQDPAKAAALLSALPAGEFRDHSLIAVINSLTRSDLTAAIALQKQFPQLSVETWNMSAKDDFFKAWAEKDAEGLTAYLNEAPEKAQPAIKAALAQALAVKDPAGALDWAAGNLSGSARVETIDKILTRLTQKDPDAALVWLNTLNAGTALSSAVKTFTEALAGADPAALLAKAETLPEGEARKAITAKAYGQMYGKNPEDMLKNLASQLPASLPDGLWRQLGENTGDMDAGISRLAVLPPEAGPDFVRGLFQRNIEWADFSKFSRIMGSLSDPENRAAAIESAIPSLLHNQAARVTEWAKSLPPAERSQVADQMEKHIYNLTDTQRRELITPLR